MKLPAGRVFFPFVAAVIFTACWLPFAPAQDQAPKVSQEDPFDVPGQVKKGVPPGKSAPEKAGPPGPGETEKATGKAKNGKGAGDPDPGAGKAETPEAGTPDETEGEPRKWKTAGGEEFEGIPVEYELETREVIFADEKRVPLRDFVFFDKLAVLGSPIFSEGIREWDTPTGTLFTIIGSIAGGLLLVYGVVGFIPYWIAARFVTDEGGIWRHLTGWIKAVIGQFVAVVLSFALVVVLVLYLGQTALEDGNLAGQITNCSSCTMGLVGLVIAAFILSGHYSISFMNSVGLVAFATVNYLLGAAILVAAIFFFGPDMVPLLDRGLTDWVLGPLGLA